MRCKVSGARLIAILIIAFMPVIGLAGESPVSKAIEKRIDEFWTSGELQIGNATIASRDMLPDLYERNRFEPLWLNPKNVNDLLEDISTIESEGLEPEDYHLSDLLALKLLIEKSSTQNNELLADYDLLLTDSLIRLCYHINWGKVDPEGMHPH